MLALTPIEDLALPADVLGISEIGRAALCEVHRKLERGEILQPRSWLQIEALLSPHELPPTHLCMSFVRCGTVACLCGWARHVAGDEGLFLAGERPQGLNNLFLMDMTDSTWSTINQVNPRLITTTHATRALRNYLTTGEPNWAEALA